MSNKLPRSSGIERGAFVIEQYVQGKLYRDLIEKLKGEIYLG